MTDDLTGITYLVSGPVENGHTMFFAGQWYVWEGGKKGRYVPMKKHENHPL